ncbi:2-hydroxyacid dehydrogenase [Nonomuraea sp. SBT364]|uniref:2-hydroxyacid dehydrogenase n=1 Tax=Nonomuraea sp. SBT364 TaxID=1580530 RepID=UPI00066B4AD1|nr:2-hydroxyacid dehydrogenase [Nonomuraea sp. SBT364]
MQAHHTHPQDVVVLVPDERGLAALSAVAGLRPLRYDVRAPLPPGAAEARAMVVPSRPVDRVLALIADLPELRLVQTLSAGTDQWQGRLPAGVALSNARGAHGAAVAEWAAAALLALYRGLPGFAADQAAARWRPRMTESLSGKRVLILGAGDLGGRLRACLEPFGARVTMVARHARDGIHPMADLPRLLPDHDVVALMLPHTPATHHLADKEFLGRMRDGAILLNAARGPIVDTDALLDETRSGRLRAILDVTDPEPLPDDHPLWHSPGVLITPHVAGTIPEADERSWQVAATQLGQFARGEQPANLVV